MKRIPVSADQFRVLDEIVIPSLMRSGDTESASLMMALALAYKFAKPPEPELPTNVYPIVKHAGDSWSRRVGA